MREGKRQVWRGMVEIKGEDETEPRRSDWWNAITLYLGMELPCCSRTYSRLAEDTIYEYNCFDIFGFRL